MNLVRCFRSASALLALAAGVMAPRAAHGGGPQPLKVTIAFTGDVSGYLEPCG